MQGSRSRFHCRLRAMRPVTSFCLLQALLVTLTLTLLVGGPNGQGILGQQVDLRPPEADMPVPALLERLGYPCESHKVVTGDGYILTLHRIPHGRKGLPEGHRRVVLLQHGLLCSSADWLMNSINKALGFQLADLGYDVWLGNARGNTYSNQHVSLSPLKAQFWNFSFHEMGKYDVPAVIDHILGETGADSLSYVGHSMGTTMFWIAMSLYPSYRPKVKVMFALAPVAFVNSTRSPLRLFAPFAKEFEELSVLFGGDRDFLPHNWLMSLLQKIVCEEEVIKEAICENIIFLICGFDRPQLNETILPIILGHTPAGTSTKTVIHFLQLMHSSLFRMFDYGSKLNKVIYGSKQPPPYDLSNVTPPVALYWGSNDWLAVPQDVAELATKLPNVVINARVNHSRFNHLDFLYAIDVNPLLYADLIQHLNNLR